MQHPWDQKRPISAWLPAGLSGQKTDIPSRTHIPMLDHEKCSRCGFCWIYCPEGCITRGEEYVINHNYCKGCGVCATECPKQAIEMVREG